MEELARALFRRLEVPPSSPFRPETIVVSSAGMARWLAMRLADEHGIWANPSFPFPRAFVETVLDTVLDEEEGAGEAFARDTLTWALASELSTLGDRPELAPLRRYLADDDGQKLFELAERIADVFDQYAVYRPDLVSGWEAGGGEGWQPVLWRALVARLGPTHLAARAERFFARLPGLETWPESLPERVSVFGVSSLPPVYLRILAALSQRMDVHLFLLCASDARWQRLRGKRHELRELAPRCARSPDLPEALRVEGEVSGLLGSWGRGERELQILLETLVEYRDEGVAHFVDPGSGSLLAALQSEVLAAEAPGRVVAEQDVVDGTLSIHACHGPMREVEVLRDQLLALFEDTPTLTPRDVIVMTPDIEAYAPFIQAVFDVSPEAPGYIPFRVADRPQRAASPVADAILSLLRVLAGRFRAGEVLDLLQLDVVRERFGLDSRAIPLVERWLADLGVCWGASGEHRAELGLPPFEENSWRFGLSRLLLGFAMPGGDTRRFAGVLPYDHVEGKTAAAAGQLAELVERLSSWRVRLAESRPLSVWKRELFELFDDFLSVPEGDAWQLRVVRDTIAGLVEAADRAGFAADVPPESLIRLLESALDRERTNHDFLAGGVTFCALLPMRSIPFRVVCLLGMNDGDFPRIGRSPEFDLVAQTPRVGDRSLRDEDRQLFLEALLSARERLLVTFVGRGLEDDGVRPPSVVVGELLDAVEARRGAEGETALRRTPGATVPHAAAGSGVSTRPAQPGAGAEAAGLPSRRKGRGVASTNQLDLFAGRATSAPPDSPASAATTAAKGGQLPFVVEHPLHAFSERYFAPGRDPRLFGFGTLELEGARARRAERRPVGPFFARPLALADDAELDLEELVAFFQHPIRHLLERRLGIRLAERDAALADREPMELSPLERHRVGSFLFDRYLDGADDELAYELARAAGLLPHGALGRLACADIAEDARLLARATLGWRREAKRPPVVVAIELGATRLVGALGNVWPRAQLHCTYSRSKARTELGMWIRHLALQLAETEGVPRESVFVGRARAGGRVIERTLAPVDRAEARARLAELVALQREGSASPLPFFPESALAYVETLERYRGATDAEERALAAARGVFFPKARGYSEGDDPYILRVFADRDPLVSELESASGVATFADLARAVLGPLVEHRGSGGTS